AGLVGEGRPRTLGGGRRRHRAGGGDRGGVVGDGAAHRRPRRARPALQPAARARPRGGAPGALGAGQRLRLRRRQRLPGGGGRVTAYVTAASALSPLGWEWHGLGAALRGGTA